MKNQIVKLNSATSAATCAAIGEASAEYRRSGRNAGKLTLGGGLRRCLMAMDRALAA